MVKGATLLTALIDNSNKVQAYDFSHLNEVGSPASGNNSPRKLTGSLMTKKKKQSDSTRVSYTFAL